MRFAAVLAISGFDKIFLADLRVPRNQENRAKKPVVYGKQAAHTFFAPYRTYVRVRDQVFGSTPLLFKYCPVVPEVRQGSQRIRWTACFPRCAAIAKRTLLAGSYTQTRCVEYNRFISRDSIGEEAGNVVQMHGTIREDRTSPVNPTWTGHRLVCNL